MVGRQHVGRVWIGAYDKPVAHIAIMGLLQVLTDYPANDLLVADEGDAVTCPVIGVDMGYFCVYQIVN